MVSLPPQRNTKNLKDFRGSTFICADAVDLGPAPWSVKVPVAPPEISNKGSPSVSQSSTEFENGSLRGSVAEETAESPCQSTPTLQVVPGRPRWTGSLPQRRTFTASIFLISTLFILSPFSCYITRVICEVDRIVLSGSLYPLCELLTLAHSTELYGKRSLCDNPSTWKDPFSNIIGNYFPLIYNQANLHRNYASEGGGATIIPEFTSPTHGLRPCAGWFRSTYSCAMENIRINSPAVVLDENLQDGQCWEFSGSSGQLTVNLTEAISISHVSIDYASPLILSQSARLRVPSNISLWVLVDDFPSTQESRMGPEVAPVSQLSLRRTHLMSLPSTSQFIHIADFQYSVSNHSKTRRVFPVPRPVTSRVALFEFGSNAGGNTTCIYWIGVHGNN